MNSNELDRKVRILQVGAAILGCFTLLGSAKLQTFPRPWRSVTTCTFLCPVLGYFAVAALHNSVGCSTALFLQGQLLCAVAFLAMKWTMGLVADIISPVLYWGLTVVHSSLLGLYCTAELTGICVKGGSLSIQLPVQCYGI